MNGAACKSFAVAAAEVASYCRLARILEEV
jgi:hypothetical protein